MMAKRAQDLSWADDVPLRTAVVVYDTRFGKTERVAQAIARGVRKEGVPTDVLSVTEAGQRPIDGYDLIGTQVRPRATSPRRPEWSSSWGRSNACPASRAITATPLTHGSATMRAGPAGRSRRCSSDSGLRIPGPRSFATVEPPSSKAEEAAGSSPDSHEYRLATGTEDRFENLGSRLVRIIRGETEGQFQSSRRPRQWEALQRPCPDSRRSAGSIGRFTSSSWSLGSRRCRTRPTTSESGRHSSLIMGRKAHSLDGSARSEIRVREAPRGTTSNTGSGPRHEGGPRVSPCSEP